MQVRVCVCKPLSRRVRTVPRDGRLEMKYVPLTRLITRTRLIEHSFYRIILMK
jgi:hypothetical protein